MLNLIKRGIGKVITMGLALSIIVMSPNLALAANTTTTLNPSDDTYVQQSSPTSNYGNAVSMFVKSDPINSREAYLKFNLSGISGVTSAKLRIFGSASWNTILSASATTDNWTQSSLHWDNKPVAGLATGSVSMTNTIGYYEIDVTSSVMAASTGDLVASFILQENAGKYTTLNSNENTTNKPQLVIISNGVDAGGDQQAPTQPTNVKGTAASSSLIDLSWNPSSDNVGVTGYDVYRNGAFVKHVVGSTASDMGLAASTAYSYYVIAKDAAGNASSPSNTIMVTTKDSITPPTTGCTQALNTTTAIQNAMKNAVPGSVISIAPGTYTGVRSTSGDPGGQGLFYSNSHGTSSNPIILTSCNPATPVVLKGVSVNDGSYGIHLSGNYWQIRNIEVTNAQKGIIIDHGNNNLLYKVKVHNIGDEGVHFRDGSSYNTLEYSTIYDTGKYQAGYGEGAYVGSDSSSNYEHIVTGNVISHTLFDGGITAEHIDVKEGASGTTIEYCTFNGTGISGENSADSFVDVKGVNTIIRYNQGFRNGNVNIVDAFQVRTHGTAYATGKNNSFDHNTVNLDNSAGYVVFATSATSGTTAQNDTRTGGGNLYSSYVN